MIERPDFLTHAGYQRMFTENKLTLGIFLPLRFYAGNMNVLVGQGELVQTIDRLNFSAVWVRDIPLFDPDFGDAGQLFDPFTYLAWLAALTKKVSLVTGSAIFTLRHPIDLAKAATTIDQLSGGRLVLGAASGDRPIEFPAYAVDYNKRSDIFAESVSLFRTLTELDNIKMDSSLGKISQDIQFLPKPVNKAIPLIVTSHSGQSLEWIAKQADGWLTYPSETHNSEGPLKLAKKIQQWRDLLPKGIFRPFMTNEWLDLVDDPNYPRTALKGGFILRTGRNGLIDLLNEWQRIGVNHAALGIQFSERPANEVIQELAEDVLPSFPSHNVIKPSDTHW